MLNKYSIGDKVRYVTASGYRIGTIYAIKACTKRHCQTTRKAGYSDIVETGIIGYSIFGDMERVRETDILEIIAEDQYK